LHTSLITLHDLSSIPII